MKFFMSDPHFNHAKIVDFCPARVTLLGMDRGLYKQYLSAQRAFRKSPKCPAVREIFFKLRELLIKNHNECLIQCINAVVRKRDILYIIGDFGFGNIKDLKKWLSKINGRKILVKGNHDRNTRVMLEMGFSDVMENDYVDLGEGDGKKYRVYMSHFPFYPNWRVKLTYFLRRWKLDTRYLHKRIVDRGQILLHGHTHDKYKWNRHNKRMIHVGIDAWGEPVSEIELIRLIKAAK